MRTNSPIRWLLAAWIFAVILLGAILTSYHQPIHTPGENILLLAGGPSPGQWRAIHLLSGSCGCSQRVMRHLLERPRLDHVDEQILVIDDDSPYLPESSGLLQRLRQQGFSVTHIAAKDIPGNVELRGVPLLLFVSPEGHLRYAGGYGSHYDQDLPILRQIRSGKSPRPLTLLGCAVGNRLKRKADPFRLKY